MNLKEAARRLGVHYQTAYKWVRSGSLTAIRVGARYEVSQAAIDQFLANRRSVLSEAEPASRSRRSTDLGFEDVMEEFEIMATDPVMTVRSVVTFAARRGAAVLGDLCLVALVGDDGIHARHAVVDHPIPAHAAFVSALLGANSDERRLGPNIVVDAFRTGQPVLIPHVSQDLLRAGTRPDMRQYIAEYPIYSLLAVPVTADDHPIGYFAFSRDTANHPYTPADQEFAMRLGERIGALVVTAREITCAWKFRNDLVAVLQERLALGRSDHRPTAEELAQWLRGDLLVSGSLSVAILDHEGRLLLTNGAAEWSSLLAPGRHTLDIIHPDDQAAEQANLDRLISGELDYFDSHSRRVLKNGDSFDCATHRAAIRLPDATLACIISVARPIRSSCKAREYHRVA